MLYDELAQYIDRLYDKFSEVNQNQLDSLSDKHKSFLRKFKRYLKEHQKLSDTFNNLHNIVLQRYTNCSILASPFSKKSSLSILLKWFLCRRRVKLKAYRKA